MDDLNMTAHLEAEGARKERAAIVAYLRREAKKMAARDSDAKIYRNALLASAVEIEAGLHLEQQS